ncbi:MAG: T9SS type A sorting domain-containing protein [Crocinitomix sp.]|nr:T9SS type A sorting domain-containing protein [Crocinitomix sp.]
MKTLLLSIAFTVICLNGFSQFNPYKATAVKEAFSPLNEDLRTNISRSGDDRDAGDLIVGDDFSDPANWNLIALDGDPNWEIVIDEPEEIVDYIGEMESTTEANGFAMFNGIQYLIGDSVTTQDAVLEYANTIDCSEIGHVTLSFEQRYRAFQTDQTFIEISNNGGVSYDFSYEINQEKIANAPSSQEPVNISIAEAAAGYEFVKIRFRWKEETGDPSFGSGYGWMIDDFEVFESWDYDFVLTSSYQRSDIGGFSLNGLDYYQISEYQNKEIQFAGSIKNIGGAARTNLKLNLQITGEDSFYTASDAITLGIDTSDSLVCNEYYLATEIGNYQLMYWADSDSTEDIADNDTLKSWFELTSGIMSRHDGVKKGNFRNIEGNTGAQIQIGCIFEINEDDEINGVLVQISNSPDNVGKHVTSSVRIYNEDMETFDLLGTGAPHEVSGSDLGNEVTIDYCAHDGTAGNLDVSAGDIILVLVGHEGGATELQFSLAQEVENGTVIGYTPDDEMPFYLANARMPMIRISMLSGCGNLDANQELKNGVISQNFPNPFDERTTINYELNTSEYVEISIADVSGKVIQTLKLGNQPAGKHELRLNASDYAEGVYFYTFNVGNEQVTKRMIVVK